MTLIYVPTMFCIFGGVGIKRQRRELKKQRELNDYYVAHKDKMVRDRTAKRVED
jgi:HAE1 family hydrophobic/amphiphilic exporter-1